MAMRSTATPATWLKLRATTPIPRWGSGKCVLKGAGFDSTVALGIEAFGRLEVEEVLPSSVPMLHKGDTSVKHTAEGHTGNKR
jgi:hypothetical protein